MLAEAIENMAQLRRAEAMMHVEGKAARVENNGARDVCPNKTKLTGPPPPTLATIDARTGGSG
jgi:hypothetical protein